MRPDHLTRRQINERLALILIACVFLAGAVGQRAGNVAGHDAERVARVDAARVASSAKRAAVHVAATARRLFTEVCLRNDIFKAVARVGEARRLRLVLSLASGRDGAAVRISRRGVRQVNDLLPILNCEATFRDKVHGAPLPPTVERQYLQIIASGWVPELHGDHIVGKHRAESHGFADF